MTIAIMIIVVIMITVAIMIIVVIRIMIMTDVGGKWKCCPPLNASKEEGDKEKDVWEVLREPERIEEASKNISL